MSWPHVKLEQVLSYRKSTIQIDDSQEYRLCRVQWYGQGVVERGLVKGFDIKTKTQQVCISGDFIVAEIDAKEGGFGIIPANLAGAVVSSHYFLFEIDLEQVEPAFLGYYVRLPAFREQVTARGSTNYSAVRPEHVLGYTMPLPSLPEQRRIVAKIERLAGKLDQVQRLRAMSTLALSRFVNAQHVNLSSERNVALHDILVLDEDRVPVMAGFTYPQVGVRAFGQGLFPKAPVDASGTTYKSFNRLYDGAVVLSQVKGWEGAVTVCGTELAGWFVSPEYRTLRCIPNAAEPRYLRHVLATEWFWSQLKNLSRGLGGRRERIRPEQFLELVIPMPTFEMQVKAAALFEKLEPIRRLQGQTANELANLLPPILEGAFNGEL